MKGRNKNFIRFCLSAIMIILYRIEIIKQYFWYILDNKQKVRKHGSMETNGKHKKYGKYGRIIYEQT
jgi:hypothetical protein